MRTYHKQVTATKGGTHPPGISCALLKYYQDNGGLMEPQTTELPPVTDEGVAVVEPQTILDTRWINQGGQLVEKSLVQ